MTADTRTALTAPEPLQRPLTGRPVHLVCCDHGLAVCGTDVTALGYVPSTTTTNCPLCAVVEAEQLPCDDPCCPMRQARDHTGTAR